MKSFSYLITKYPQPLKKLSDKCGIPVSRLEAIKADEIEPSYEEIRALSKIFHIPISYLLSPHPIDLQYSALFRKAVHSQSNAILESQVQLYIQNLITLVPDHSSAQHYLQFFEPVENTYRNAEILAHRFREVYFNNDQLAPLTNLPTLLGSNLKFLVKVIEIGQDADGVSARIEGLIFLIISPRFEGRMLFTLAHELAHAINHHRGEDYVHFDKKITFSPKNDPEKTERFANAFASCLLLPQLGVAKMLKKIREYYKIPLATNLGDVEILYLSRFYGVSFDVAAHRCEQLDLLPKGGSHSLSTRLKKDYGSPEKRANKLGIPPRDKITFPSAPRFVLDRAVELIRNGDYSIGKISEMLSIPINTLLEHNAKID